MARLIFEVIEPPLAGDPEFLALASTSSSLRGFVRGV